MNPFYPFLLGSIFATSALAAGAQTRASSADDAAPLSLREVVREALERNPALESARETWSAMRERVPQALAWDDPKISFEESLDRFVSVPGNAFADQTLSVEQAIPISGQNQARGRATEAEALQAFEHLRRMELDVAASAASSYYRLANAYAQIDLNRRNLVSLKEIEQVSRSRYEVGDQGAVYVLVAQTEYSKLLEAESDLKLEVATEESKLNVLLNKDAFSPMGQPVDVPGTPAIPSIDALRQLTFKHRPEVQMALAMVQRDKALLQLAHRDWIPDPVINVEAQRYNGAAQGVSEIDAGISFNVPWVNARKYSAEVAEATDNLQAAQADLLSVNNEATGLLRDALQQIETSHHHVELYREKLIPQAQQAFDASQLGYEAGKLGFNDWITAQRTLRDLQAAEQQHLTDYEVAVAELEAVIGCSLIEQPQISNSEQ